MIGVDSFFGDNFGEGSGFFADEGEELDELELAEDEDPEEELLLELPLLPLDEEEEELEDERLDSSFFFFAAFVLDGVTLEGG